MELKFSVNKQVIKRTDDEILVQGSQNYVICSFTFDSTWASLNKKAIFGTINESNEYVAYCEELNENDKCGVPWEALQNNELFVSVYGADDEEQLVTVNQEIVYLLESGYTTELTPTVDPSPDVFTRIWNELGVKFDEVRLNGSLIEFYANGVLVDSVSVQSASSVSWDNITDKPETFPPQNHDHRIRDLIEDSEHRTVSDDDIEYWNDKPVKTSDLVNDSNFVSDSNYVHTDNNFSDSEKNKLEDLENYDDSEVRSLINGKVDKVTGKGLSTNDFTNTLKNKLDNLENYDDSEIKEDIQDLEENKADNIHTHSINDVTNLQTSLNSKVDKVTGKGLSENDFTNTLKTKLDGLSNYDDTLVKGDIQSLQTGKADKTEISDMATKTWVNGQGYLTEHQSLANYYNKSQTDGKISEAISGVTQFDYKVVATLPSTGVKGTIYLTNKQTVEEQDIYDEFIWVNNAWEKIGTTQVDLSNYYTKSQVDIAISSHHDDSKQNVISDLTTIRSNASLGASALQSGDNISELVNDSGYLTQHQSLANYYTKSQTDSAISNHHDSSKADASAISDMATKTWVGNQGYLTQHQSLANYSTTAQMNSAISTATSGMATQTWVNSQGFLKTHQSLANYSTTAQMNTAISNAVSGKESSSNKVTSISSSSTNTQYPSAKAVYDYIQSLDASDVQYPLDD